MTTFCRRHHCYLLSRCACTRTFHRASGSILGRLQCTKPFSAGWARLDWCGRVIPDLPTIEMSDGSLAEISGRIEHCLTETRAAELDWAIRLTLCAGTPQLTDDADSAVLDAVGRFCRARDSNWNPLSYSDNEGPTAFRIDSGDERLVMAAVLRVARALVFAGDLHEQVRRFCQINRPRWDLIGLHLPRARRAGRLKQAFHDHGLPVHW